MTLQSRRAHNPRILRRQGIAIRAAHRVIVTIRIILSRVHRVALPPRLRVEAAVRPDRAVVLGQDVRVEEVAGIVGSVRARVVVVVLGLRFAGGGALAGVVRAWEDFDADV